MMDERTALLKNGPASSTRYSATVYFIFLPLRMFIYSYAVYSRSISPYQWCLYVGATSFYEILPCFVSNLATIVRCILAQDY